MLPDAADPVALTQALVRCPTVTPDAGPALDLLRPRLGLAPDPEASAIRESPVVTLSPDSTSGSAPALRFRDATPAAPATARRSGATPS